MRAKLKNNLSLKILAFCIAVMLWLIVVNVDNPITQKTFTGIPVNVINTEVLAESQQTFQIVDDTQYVSVTVSAKRSVISKITPDDIVAVADMKELTLKTQVPIDVSISGYTYESATAYPRNLQVKLEEEETKKFPIVPTTSGTVRDGYVLGEIEAIPEKVSIRGPKSVVDKISRVEAEVSVSGLSEDAILPSSLVLYDKDNNEIDQKLLTHNLGVEGVSVSVQLLNTKNIPIEFDTSEIVTAEGYEFAGITYEPKEVQISGEKAVLDSLDIIRIPSAALQINGLKARKEIVVDISDHLPANIELVDENASSVVVTINVEKDGTKTFDVTVASIAVDNLASNLQLTFTTVDAIEVRLRGPENVLADYNADKEVSIDLEKYEKPGEYTVPLNVNVPENCVLENEVTVKIRLDKKQ